MSYCLLYRRAMARAPSLPGRVKEPEAERATRSVLPVLVPVRMEPSGGKLVTCHGNDLVGESGFESRVARRWHERPSELEEPQDFPPLTREDEDWAF